MLPKKEAIKNTIKYETIATKVVGCLKQNQQRNTAIPINVVCIVTIVVKMKYRICPTPHAPWCDNLLFL